MTYEQYEEYEDICFDYLLRQYGWKIHTTPRYAAVDGVATKQGALTHIVEFKSRNLTMAQMKRFGTYLISYDKIRTGIDISNAMHVPFILVVYLIDDRKTIGLEVYNPFTYNLVEMDVRETETQQSIEGGKIVRKNAYIDFENFHVL